MNARRMLLDHLGKVGARLSHLLPAFTKTKTALAKAAPQPAAPAKVAPAMIAPHARQTLASIVRRGGSEAAHSAPTLAAVVPLKPPAPAIASQPSKSPAAKEERARCKAIFNHGHQLGLTHQACALAFQTHMTAEDARRVLDDLQAVSVTSGGRRFRMGIDGAGIGHEPRSIPAEVASILAASAKARGDKPGATSKRPLYTRRPFVPDDDLPPAA